MASVRAKFQGAISRITQANTLINKLHNRNGKYFKHDPVRRVVEYDEESGLDVHKLVFVKKFPQASTHYAVEAIEGLRAALDLAIYTTALLSGHKNSGCTFPIGDNEKSFEGIIQSKCKDVPDEILNVVRSFHPYKDGNDAIWSLNKVCNSNKHRMLIPVAIASNQMSIKRMSVSGLAQIFAPKMDHEKNEMIFAKVSPGKPIDYHIDFKFDVTFGEIEGVGGAPAVPALRTMSDEVRKIVNAIMSKSEELFGNA